MLCLNTLFDTSSLALSLRSLSDSVLHLFYTLLYTPCLLYSPFFSFSLNLFFFLCLFPSLHLTFLLLPSLSFSLTLSHFISSFLSASLSLSYFLTLPLYLTLSCLFLLLLPHLDGKCSIQQITKKLWHAQGS